MSERILFFGGTGHIGKNITEIIYQKYNNLILLSRNPDKHNEDFNKKFNIEQADLLDPDSIKKVIAPNDIVIFYYQTRYSETPKNEYISAFNKIVETLLNAKPQQVIFIGHLPLKTKETSFEQALLDIEIETILRNSGLCYTILRHAMLMEYLYFYVRGNRANIIGRPEKAFHWISLKEVGAFLKDCINNPAYFNSTLHLLGPEKLSLKEALDVYIENLKPNAKITPISVAMMSSIATISNNPELSFNANWLEYLEDSDGEISVENNDLSDSKFLTGKETMKDWCEEEKHVWV